VEAKREDWSIDPFVLTEKDGYFYGRGSGDDKAQAAIWIANLIRYKREGLKLDRDIIVALTADEEGGGPYSGIQWLLKNHKDLIDAEYCLNEGGWGESANGVRLSNDVQLSEKYVINYRFEVRNKGGHSSLPVDDNAIYHLAGALDRLSHFRFPLKTNEVTRAYFRAMSTIEKGAVGADLDPFQDAVFGVFQYMIGNTDFSVAALHNVELFFTNDGNVMPIAYDFDFAGAVNATYAIPDERLGIPNVRRRIFRGYCGSDPTVYAKVFALFNEKRAEIYALYRDPIGKLLDDDTVRETLKYFDDFYETINDPRSAKRQIIQACVDRR